MTYTFIALAGVFIGNLITETSEGRQVRSAIFSVACAIASIITYYNPL